MRQLEAFASGLKHEFNDEETARFSAEKTWQAERRRFDEEVAVLQRQLTAADSAQKARAEHLLEARRHCEELDRRRTLAVFKHENASALNMKAAALRMQQMPRSSQDVHGESHRLTIEGGRLAQQHRDSVDMLVVCRKEFSKNRELLSTLEKDLAIETGRCESLNEYSERLHGEVQNAERSEALAQRKATDARNRLLSVREEAQSQDTCLTYLRQENKSASSKIRPILTTRNELAGVEDQLEPLRRQNSALLVDLRLEAEQRARIVEEASNASAKHEAAIDKYIKISSEFGDVSAHSLLREKKLTELERSLSEVNMHLRNPELHMAASRASQEHAVQEELRCIAKKASSLEYAQHTTTEKHAQIIARKGQLETQLLETQQCVFVHRQEENRALDEVSAACANRNSRYDAAVRNATLLKTSTNQTSTLAENIRELEKDRLRFPSMDIAGCVASQAAVSPLEAAIFQEDDLSSYIPGANPAYAML